MSLQNLSIKNFLEKLPQNVLAEIQSQLCQYIVINAHSNIYMDAEFTGVFTVYGPSEMSESDIVSKLLEQPNFYRHYLSCWSEYDPDGFIIPHKFLKREILYILSLLNYDLEKYRDRILHEIKANFRVFLNNEEIIDFDFRDYLHLWTQIPPFNDLENRLSQEKVIKPEMISIFLEFLQSEPELPDSISSLSEYFRDHVQN